MRNSSNVITLKERQLNCQSCRFHRDCLVKADTQVRSTSGRSAAVSGCVVRRGAHIYRMGDAFDALYVVRSGAIKTYWLGDDGNQQVTGFYLPGEVFGLDSISSQAYVSSAVALDTSGICTLPYAQLRQLCLCSQETMERLMGRLSARIRESEEAFIVLGHKSADERMAWFLTDLSRRQARLGVSSREINLPMTRTDIGSYLMLAVETVSRVLTRLQGSGIIDVNRNQVTVKSAEKLKLLAESSADTSGLATCPERGARVRYGDCRDLTSGLRPAVH